MYGNLYSGLDFPATATRIYEYESRKNEKPEILFSLEFYHVIYWISSVLTQDF